MITEAPARVRSGTGGRPIRGVCLFLGVLAAAWLAASGCASKAAPPHTPTVFSGRTGEAATLEEIAEAASRADVLVIGETHGHPVGLSFAAEVWTGVLDRTDRAALSLEFFNRPTQAAIDDYLSGLTDEAAFLTATGRTEDSYPSGHRAMVEAARAAGRPVIASNAPRVYTGAARLRGYDSLSSATVEQRRLFVVPVRMPEGRYRDEFMAFMTKGDESHGAGKDPDADPELMRRHAEGIFRAQAMWDATMADSIAGARARGLGPVVQVIGRFHSDHDGGLIQQFRSMRPYDRVVTISVIDAASDSLLEDDLGRADFVVYAGPAPQ